MAVSVQGLSAPACASQINTNVAERYEHLYEFPLAHHYPKAAKFSVKISHGKTM